MTLTIQFNKSLYRPSQLTNKYFDCSYNQIKKETSATPAPIAAD